MLKFDTLNLAAARQIIFAAETEAYRIGCPCTISVVDMQGQLIAQVRMDVALPGRTEESKYNALNALSAALCLRLHQQPGGFTRATIQTLVDMIYRGQVPIGWEDDTSGTLMVEAGGVVIQSKGALLGAIGISSGSREADHAIALAALDIYTSCHSYDEGMGAIALP